MLSTSVGVVLITGVLPIVKRSVLDSARTRAPRKTTIKMRYLGVLAVLAMAVAACNRTPPDTASTLTLDALPSPAQGASSGPQLTTAGDRAILSWIESANFRGTLKIAERTDAGWSEPRVVASGQDLLVNAADVPSVAALTDGTLVAQWLQASGPDPEAYNLHLSWSRDAGETWSPAERPHHDGTRTQHGFASLFQPPAGGIGVVWLDGRAMDPEKAEGAGGSMALWAAGFDADGKQSGETPIDERVCDCCQTSAAATSDGVIVAYRGRTADEVRDILVTRLVQGRWTPPTMVHRDNWNINGCPVNGPAVSARGRDVAVAWFTGASGEGRTFVAFSNDGGLTFDDPIRVDDAVSEGQVDVELLADKAAVISWSEFADRRSQFRVRRVEPSGSRSRSVTIADLSGNHYPRLAAIRNELLFTWVAVEDGYPRVRTARGRF
jgi:hypothetical protein